jgi:hypothetical protein
MMSRAGSAASVVERARDLYRIGSTTIDGFGLVGNHDIELAGLTMTLRNMRDLGAILRRTTTHVALAT